MREDRNSYRLMSGALRHCLRENEYTGSNSQAFLDFFETTKKVATLNFSKENIKKLVSLIKDNYMRPAGDMIEWVHWTRKIELTGDF